MQRQAQIERKSKETQIKAVLNIDGSGKTNIKTPIGFLDHMLELFAFHGYFDIDLSVTGDTHIDIHHTNEDIGIVLGKAFKKALGEEKAGIKRFGHAFAPMEAAVGLCVIDISGRGFYKFNSEELIPAQKGTDGYEFSHFEHFMESFAHNLGATLSFTLQNPSEDLHTNLETMFKSLGLALDQATKIDPRREGQVPSTKGIID
ncbi:MAG: imidazoleglycerol-phosphate dehydratase [Candidatus Omnitrophica bacterium]|nr:imidazoleglycerol-phosphate dehydratase [Candidatus Omnitrophota bacterium]MDE2008831.1 imidazoleglycerol-phosphate dehydratase [Candidatus Omnitrophota bacterium]MDE2213606.1 imidazoleglycerol-phosphate dehydratase [Candidatus Omnitrophota bacterium]MDE2230493.1 imidazoleglycerol-phosphate dehydratase [Candidatus Omnitrophota bacterium]